MKYFIKLFSLVKTMLSSDNFLKLSILNLRFFSVLDLFLTFKYSELSKLRLCIGLVYLSSLHWNRSISTCNLSGNKLSAIKLIIVLNLFTINCLSI